MTDEHLGELSDMAAATDYGTSPGRMKYALSFASSRGMVSIDYDAATVRSLAVGSDRD
jgi:hypothetical protein